MSESRKRIVVLGSTGSIGENVFNVLCAFPDRFQVIGLAACSRIERLAAQAQKLSARVAVTADVSRKRDLSRLLPADIISDAGSDALIRLVLRDDVDLVVCAIVGIGGLQPVLAALDSNKTVALASKEVLVMAGGLIQDTLKHSVPDNDASEKLNRRLLPIDSEHSAIFQCLEGRHRDEVSGLILTASGGALRTASREEIAAADLQRVMAHPTWRMGPKVTIDSASLMNKALELIEARYLFDVSPQKLRVLIHPQSIIHSMVEFVDGALLAQLACPDMRFAIQYALTYPERVNGNLPRLNFAQTLTLQLEEPDRRRFPSIDFAEEALRCGGTMPTAMNAANEVAVEKFRRGEIAFPAIWSIVEKTMANHHVQAQENLSQILEADRSARCFAANVFS